MRLWICARHATTVIGLKVGIGNEKTYPRSFVSAFAHPIPTAAIARPIAVIRILVRTAVARDDYCIFVCACRSQRGDALEPLSRSPPAVAGA